MALPLEGYRVLEWTIWQQGPACGAMLGDLGADIIKIEERTNGDIGRGMMAMIGSWMGVGGRNFYFEYNNRNKRGMTLDLRKDEAKEIVYKLIAETDVFLQNFRIGVAERLGMDYETLRKYNPRLIYAHGTGWGPEGPRAESPSMDYAGLGRTGLMFVGGERGEPPVNYQPGLADQMGAIFTAYGILAALLVRERTGEGQKVDASLLGGVTCGLEGLNLACKTVLGQELPRPSRKQAGNPLYNHYQCKDGQWIIICLAASDRYWPQFCEFMGIEHLEKDPKFESHESRAQNGAELVMILDSVFATKDRDEWYNILSQDPDFMVSPVLSLSDLEDDPQMWANNYLTKFNHPTIGEITMPGMPVSFSKTPGRIKREAPELGQHTEEILLELGYGWDQITGLKDREII
ncbi:CaiB/BaiF CoA transferase family protein [Thermodesulfobacteriota bacterium]